MRVLAKYWERRSSHSRRRKKAKTIKNTAPNETRIMNQSVFSGTTAGIKGVGAFDEPAAGGGATFVAAGLGLALATGAAGEGASVSGGGGGGNSARGESANNVVCPNTF